MGRLRLLKLLYIADRERIKCCGRPITGDRIVAMDHGPVLTRTYYLIKGEDFSADLWDPFIESVGRDVVLKADPGNGDLSRNEMRVLHDVSFRYRDLDDYGVAAVTHQFAEWIRNQPAPGMVKAIPMADVLEATGRAGDAAGIADAARAEQSMSRLLASV